MAITPLPDAPETTDTPQQFNSKAFAWVQSLDTFVTEANAQATTVNSDASSAAQSAIDATTNGAAQVLLAEAEAQAAAQSAIDATTNGAAQVLLAEAEAQAAAASAAQSALSADVSLWVSGTTYAVGDNVFSPIDFQTYRSKSAFTSSTDPSADSTNWEKLSGGISTGKAIAMAIVFG